jgi:hypothetical protein
MLLEKSGDFTKALDVYSQSIDKKMAAILSYVTVLGETAHIDECASAAAVVVVDKKLTCFADAHLTPIQSRQLRRVATKNPRGGCQKGSIKCHYVLQAQFQQNGSSGDEESVVQTIGCSYEASRRLGERTQGDPHWLQV